MAYVLVIGYPVFRELIAYHTSHRRKCDEYFGASLFLPVVSPLIYTEAPVFF